jgi:hypothetical protein
MIDTIFQLLQAHRRYRAPRVLHINYRWERVLRQAMKEYRGLLPVVTPLTIFGMYIYTEYTYGPWAWIDEG